MKKLFFLASMSLFFACEKSKSEKVEEVQNQDTVSYHHEAFYTDSVLVDGSDADEIWSKATWYPMDQVWLGSPMDSGDFKGRFKLAWNNNQLFLLAEIEDDTVIDVHADKLVQWWDDDCLEIFVDEDNSDENHQFNHTAFAYHVALSNDVVDLGPDSLPHFYNDHVTTVRKTSGKKTTWECAIKIFDKSFVDGGKNTPRKLSANEVVGFMLAYCDNDHSETRENFIGSIPIEGEEKDQGWIKSSVFGDLILRK